MAKKKAKQKKRQTPVKKKRKILYGRIFLAIFLLAMMIVLIVVLVPKKIKNISVSGNQFLSDQEVIKVGFMMFVSRSKRIALFFMTQQNKKQY